MATAQPDWKEVDETTSVFRFVSARADATPRADWFLSDNERAARDKTKVRANRVEKEHRELLDALSVYKTKEDAQAEWDEVRRKADERGEPMRLPESIADVVLEPGCGVELDDRGEEGGHLYAKAPPEVFAVLKQEVRLGEDPTVRLYP